jgi:hypothetical protein
MPAKRRGAPGSGLTVSVGTTHRGNVRRDLVKSATPSVWNPIRISSIGQEIIDNNFCESALRVESTGVALSILIR